MTVGGEPGPDPSQSALEIYNTFDGNSAPAKKTTITRWEQYVGEVPHVEEHTSSMYYLRSTPLGGKVVAQLDETGYKRTGYVFAGGTRIATQNVWSPGAGYEVAWGSTSPATGSEYMVAGSFMSRQELDPLGADVTYPPDPLVPSEPIFYNPVFDHMPLQIEGGPSEEYERANQEWAAEMHAAFYLPRAEDLWQAGKHSAAMKLIANNPNLGVEYRSVTNGQVTKSGSYFGQDAADFLFGIHIAESAGWIVPQRGTTISIGVTSSSFLVGGSDPQNQVARVQNCATPNSVVERYHKESEAQWERTKRTGQENGSLIFYEPATNQYLRISLSEGKHFDGVPALPDVRIETSRAISEFRKANRHVYFLAFFHTHPDFTGGESRKNTPTGGDLQYQLDFGNPLGIIRSGKGYGFFSDGNHLIPST